MSTLRAGGPILLAGVLLSGIIVVISGIWFIKPEQLAGTDKDWATLGGAIAMAFFAFMVGAGSMIAAAVLVRLFPPAVILIGVVAVVLGIYVTSVALDQKPVLAPLFVALHFVFVGLFGVLLPYRLYVDRRAGLPHARLT